MSFQGSVIEVRDQAITIGYITRILHGAIPIASGVDWQELVTFLWFKK